jgi:hypothetical protein
MADFPRDLPHLHLFRRGRPEVYTTKIPPPRRKLPQRDRATHAETLRAALSGALADAGLRRHERILGVAEGTPGFYLEFQIPAGSENAAELLEDRRKHIELVALLKEAEGGPARATVFVPDTAAEHFIRKVESYRTDNTLKGKPKNEALVARLDTVALAALLSLYTDDPAMLPRQGETIWWEVWIRHGHAEIFDHVAARLGIPLQEQRLIFPDREVRLIYGDEVMLARLFVNSDAIAELRRARDTPSAFMERSNVEQAASATSLATRLQGPESRNVSVCFLDTGVTQAHPLLAPALDLADVQAYDPNWSIGDERGHGTNMAGTSLYGDLMPLLQSSGPIILTHCLESVKMLPDEDENDPRLYGAIMAESVARAEIQAPKRRRAICMAITSDLGTNRGRPSSWSAKVDQLCFGDDDQRRLIFVSAGNVRDGLTKDGYQARNETEPIENPAQAWNTITVGAYTEKITITDPSYSGWQPIAPAGDLCPTSRTSLTWERQWPIKPDVVFEGGNWAAQGQNCDCPEDLGILTTYRDPSTRHFDIFRDTSAATALAGNLAGRIWATMPERWPETIRGLMVHSAEWTLAMKKHFSRATTEQQKRALLRKYGYGVPKAMHLRCSALPMILHSLRRMNSNLFGRMRTAEPRLAT